MSPARQHGCKLINLARGAIRNARLARKTQRRKHGNLLNSRNALNARERRITNATRRHIHNATARNIVSSVRYQAQVRHQVFDLLAVIERGAAHNAVRNLPAPQCIFHHATERVHSVKHRNFLPRRARCIGRHDGLGHFVGLSVLIRCAQHAHLLTRALPRVERLRLATLVVPNQRVGRGHYMFR